jgi:hypothetical protein
MGLLYPLKEEKVPKFLFNGICYSKCPNLTQEDKKNPRIPVHVLRVA